MFTKVTDQSEMNELREKRAAAQRGANLAHLKAAIAAGEGVHKTERYKNNAAAKKVATALQNSAKNDKYKEFSRIVAIAAIDEIVTIEISS